MLAQHNVIALEWLSAEVGEALQRCEQRLAELRRQPDNRELRLQLGRQLHQVQGTLRLAELSGPALLLEEMEALLEALPLSFAAGDDGVEKWTPGLTVLASLCRSLPQYLQAVRDHHTLQVQQLIPLFDRLRAVSGGARLSLPPLFNCDLSVSPASTQALVLDAEKRADMVAKLDKMAGLALQSYLQQSSGVQGLDYLEKVFARTAKLTAASTWQNFWLAAEALVALLQQGEMDRQLSEKLLRELRHCLSKLALSNGADSVTNQPPEHLFTSLLFYLAGSTNAAKPVVQIQRRFSLSAQLLSSERFEQQACLSLAQQLEAAALALQTGSIDGEAGSSEPVSHCAALLDALAVLGQARLYYALRKHGDDGGAQPHVLADALNKTAATLRSQPPAAEPKLSADPDQTNPWQQLARDSAELINAAQDALMSFVDSGWASAELQTVPAQLHNLTAKLSTAGLSEPAALLTSCAAYIDEQLIAAGKQPKWSELDALADAMASVDYYLACRVDGIQPADHSLLQLAENCVAGLGYPAGVGDSDEPMALKEPMPRPAVDEKQAPAPELDPEVLEFFLEEAGEILDRLHTLLPKWQADPTLDSALAEVRRAFHTLKGSGRMAGAEQCGELAWQLEDMLNQLIEGHFSVDAARFALLNKAVAVLPEMFAELAQGRELPASRIEYLLRDASALRQQQSPLLSDSPGDNQGEVIKVFVGEAEQHLQVIERYLDSIISYPVRLSEELQRALHTLKGSSKMAEVWPLANLITPLEELTKEMRALRLTADQSLVALIAKVVEQAREMLARLAAEPGVTLIEAEATIAEIETESSRRLAAADGGGEQSIGQQELLDFLLVYGEQLQNLLDAIEQGGAGLSSALFRNYAGVMGQFANRSEELGSQATAEMAQALQVMFSRTTDPLPEDYPRLVVEALEQLMTDLNRLAAEQSASGDSQLLDQLRDYELVAEQDSPAAPTPPQEAAAQPSAGEGRDTEGLIDPDADPEILDIFMEEGRDLLDSLDEAIHQWLADHSNSAPSDSILRSLHTLKGGARLSGLPMLGDLCHDFEELINREMVKPERDIASLLVQVQNYQDRLVDDVNRIDELLHGGAALPQGAERESAELPEVAEEPEHEKQLASSEELTELESADNQVMSIAGRGPQEMIKVPARLLEQLINLAGENSIARGRVEEQVTDINFSLEEMGMTVSRLQDQVRVLDKETEAQILFRQEQMASEGVEDFDPLEFDRYSHLQELSRALMESASDLVDLRGTVVDKKRDIEALLSQQGRVNTELQEGLMRSQMVHFSRMVPRLRRGVRQLAGELGKQVEFKVFNAEGEMDRRVLERIIPALEHLLRNAIDHGIEVADSRRQAGKAEAGKINMYFERQGGDVVIRIADDGAGIDLHGVRRKAESLGLLDTEVELSDKQLLEYIFHAGFSTAQNVTQISGRGVGMDVVRSEIKQLGGAISVSSERGQGTEFTIRLPFTVSVNRALLVSAGGEIYAVPLNHIEGIVRISPYELEVYYEPGGPDYNYAGQDYKVNYLGQLIGSGKPLLDNEFEPRPVLLMRNAEPATAVQVDSILGAREVVVKTLGPQFSVLAGVSGATILGDGGVVIILDLLSSIRASQTRLLQQDSRELTQLEQHQGARRVMVVDDSVTVRKVTSRLLERQNMEVLLARDGLEAMQQLQSMERLPDVMLLDIEMPRMDGFEVASQMKSNPRLQAIPVIMVSSRTGEKHRQRAKSLGVMRFLGKPYQEIQLLKAIDEVIVHEELV